MVVGLVGLERSVGGWGGRLTRAVVQRKEPCRAYCRQPGDAGLGSRSARKGVLISRSVWRAYSSFGLKDRACSPQVRNRCIPRVSRARGVQGENECDAGGRFLHAVNGQRAHSRAAPRLKCACRMTDIPCLPLTRTQKVVCTELLLRITLHGRHVFRRDPVLSRVWHLH